MFEGLKSRRLSLAEPESGRQRPNLIRSWNLLLEAWIFISRQWVEDGDGRSVLWRFLSREVTCQWEESRPIMDLFQVQNTGWKFMLWKSWDISFRLQWGFFHSSKREERTCFICYCPKQCGDTLEQAREEKQHAFSRPPQVIYRKRRMRTSEWPEQGHLM